MPLVACLPLEPFSIGLQVLVQLGAPLKITQLYVPHKQVVLAVRFEKEEEKGEKEETGEKEEKEEKGEKGEKKEKGEEEEEEEEVKER